MTAEVRLVAIEEADKMRKRRRLFLRPDIYTPDGLDPCGVSVTTSLLGLNRHYLIIWRRWARDWLGRLAKVLKPFKAEVLAAEGALGLA